MTDEPRHGDPRDYPDIPADTDLSDAYFQRVMPLHIKEEIAKRRAEKDAPAGRGS